MVKAKLSKKQLTEADEFITLTQRAYLFASDHARKILYAVAAVVVVVAAIFLYQWWQRDKEAKAGRDLSAVMAAFQRVGSPSQEDYRSFLPKFDEVSTKYSGTPSGRLSLLYKASVHLRLKEFDEAIRAYQVFLEKGAKEKVYHAFALEGLGYALEGKKDYDKALESYKKVLDLGDGFPLADIHLSMGRCYEKMGKNKEAVENYEAYMKESPKSPIANVLIREMSRLQ